MNPGDKVRKKANPGRVGVLGSETSGPPHRLRVLVTFLDSQEDEWVLKDSLERVETKPLGPYELILAGKYGRVSDLRGAITYHRLSGKLANLIYSLNTTSTRFLPYQFKPVLQFLDSPSNGILIADEVGLGKTIEAGLIWTELRAREDARRLLVVCPAVLRNKWQSELSNRFGVQAEKVERAGDLLDRLKQAQARPQDGFALIASMQGLRPPTGWNSPTEPSQSGAAKLARFLDESELEEPLFDLVVIDEAHYLKNQNTQTHRLAALLRPVTLSMVMLSATPIQMRSTDLFNLLHLLDEDAFPYEGVFDWMLRANAPVVRLRDRILAGVVDRQEFEDTLREIHGSPLFRDNQQIQYFLENPPDDDRLVSARGRAELADQLDRLNPLSKVVTRTLKRDVDANRVVRDPHVIKAKMSVAERQFYDAVTAKVRDFCARLDMSEGFMLTIPQRQMASSMAAACQGWHERLIIAQNDEDEEILAELDADDLSSPTSSTRRVGSGALLRELVSIAKSMGDAKALREHDSKYNALVRSLRGYWKDHPQRKVVLFSFYKKTLHYLADRLAEENISSIVLHGGMDKTAALAEFEADDGPRILLSSEVASEGVDLQFSSVLINYDLPWNPAKIEQRIGRIDRIGQEQPRILIWNFVYEDSVDDRVCEALLDRLNIFKHALGSMEAILGDEIRTLTYQLLSHTLTPEQERHRIDQTYLAIEQANRQQAQLEAEATTLIAHGEFIQNKVKAANELGRYILGDDLLAYVRDFMMRTYPGTRIIADPRKPELFRIELSTDARVEFNDFLQQHRLQGRTAILASTPLLFRFENRQGSAERGIERITQDHPIVRFVSDRHVRVGGAALYHPIVAAQVSVQRDGITPGIYVFAVARWSVSGSREVERLEYVIKRLSDGEELDADLSEAVVNALALKGTDWFGAATDVDPESAAAMQDECRAMLEDSFLRFRDAYQREDADRIEMMLKSLRQHLERKRQKINERIATAQLTGDSRRQKMIPALKGQMAKEEMRIEQRMAELRMKATISSQDKLVSSGILKII
ncbi:MAG: SNF2-related protein [Brachymonas denitrificans]